MIISFDAATSLLVYLVVLSSAAAFIHFAQNDKLSAIKRRIFLISGLALPTLLGGLRHGVGADYRSYSAKTEIATRMNVVEFYNTFDSMEPSVWLLGNISQLFGNSVLFFAITSFLVTLFLYLGVKNFGIKRTGLAMLLLLMVIFPQSLSGVRQGVAIALCFYGLSFIPQGDLRKYVLTIGLSGILFHFSSFVMLVMYPLYWFIVKKSLSESQYKKRVTLLAVSTPAAVAIGLFLIQFVPVLDKYTAYYTRFMDSFAHKIGAQNMLPEIFALLFLVVMYRYVVNKSSLGKLALMTTVIMIVLNLTGYIIPLIGRLGDYLMPIFLVVFAGLPDIFNNERHRRLAILFVIMWAVLFFIGAFYFHGSGSIFPYSLRLYV